MQKKPSSDLNPGEETKTHQIWDSHYTKNRSRQNYPDENLVRLIAGGERGAALDFGCGSGRHTRLLQEMGYSPVYGTDVSSNALEITASAAPGSHLFLIPEDLRTPLPLEDGSMMLVVLWGVLHYNSDETIQYTLREIKRILAPEGRVAGTIRSSRDTHFAANPDMSGASIRLFDRQGATDLLSPFFSSIRFGHIERIPVGEEESRVAHWIFEAR